MTRREESASETRARTRSLQIVLLCVAVLVILWCVSDPRFRNSGGNLHALIILPLALAGSLGVLATTLAGEWKVAGRWIAVGLMGQAVTLQLIVAGPVVGYHDYKNLLTELESGRVLSVAVLSWLAVQTFLVAAGLTKERAVLRGWFARNFSFGRFVAIATIAAFSGATYSVLYRGLAPWVLLDDGGELLTAAYLQLINIGTIIVAGLSMPGRGAESLVDRIGLGEITKSATGWGVDRFVLLLAAASFVLAAVLSTYSYQRHPHVPDEVAYLMQARYFAVGQLWMAPPPVPDAFSIDLMHFGPEQVYTVSPPGWPAMLAVGVVLGTPWLVNPVLGALNIILSYLLLIELYDRRTARLATLILVASPWYVFLAMSFMPHIFTMTCALGAALGVVASRKTGNAVFAWLAGGAMGVISLVRPLEALLVAVLLGLWSIGLGGQRLRLPAIVGMVLVALCAGLTNLLYNQSLTGSAFLFPIIAYTDTLYGSNSNALGFGPDRGLGWEGLDPLPGHGFFDVVVNANFNLFATNTDLFGWAAGSLLFILLAVFSGRMNRSDRLLLATSLTVIGIHSFYYFSGGPDFGARYWFLILLPCVGLAARGVTLFADQTKTHTARSTVTLSVVTLSAMALVTFVPWRAMDKYYHYRGMQPGIDALAVEKRFGRSVVLIQGNRHPDYHSAVVYNSLDWEADGPIYVWDATPAVRAAVLAHYADRPIWVVAGPTRTGAGYQVLQGPVRADELDPQRGTTPP